MTAVLVSWRKAAGTAQDVEQAARDVVQTVLGERQRRIDAPRLVGVRGADAATSQSSAALGYALSEAKIVGVEWSDLGRPRMRLLTDSGETLELKARARTHAGTTVAGMDDVKPKRARKPATVYVRPGSRLRLNKLDPTLGLEELLGEVLWMPASRGAYIAVIERNAKGNTVGCGRLSGEDSNETMITQVDGLLGLESRCEEISFRYLILAVDMSGTRPVRYRPNMPFEPGTAERDDMVRLDRFIDEGWVEHVAWFSEDRIARKVLPAQMLLERWQENEIGLWLALRGGQIDYLNDEFLLNMLTVASADMRNRIVRGLRAGALRKGPLAGNGHLHSTPTGFIRDARNRPQEDPAVWPYLLRMFELADVGLASGGVGLSEREIATQLAEEGFEIDHDRVRTMLKDPIYATGEWTVSLSGIEIPQKPIELKTPVAIDRFQRIQDWFALRKGSSTNTELGEFLFNYVACVHKQCEGESGGAQNRPIRLRGYRLLQIKDESQKLRHNPVTPACCKQVRGRGKGGAWGWKREVVEPPVVQELRKLVTHPEILRQAALAERHAVASTTARLTPEQRVDLERELESLAQQRQAATDEWVAELEPGQPADYDDFRRLDQGFTKRIESVKRRLANDEAMRMSQGSSSATGGQQESRLDAFLEILTVETPTDPRMKALRARLFSQIVNRIIIDDDGKGPITITIEGHLVPPDSPVEVANPLFAAADFLDRYTREKQGIKSREERLLEDAAKVKTDFESSHAKSVSTILPELARLPTGKALKRLARPSLANGTWHFGVAAGSGGVAWRLVVQIATGEAARAAAMGPAERAVADALAQGGVWSTPDLAAALGLSQQESRWAVSSLRRRGWLRSARIAGLTVVCLADELVDPKAPRPEATQRVTPELPASDEGLPPKVGASRRQYAGRRSRALDRARAESLSVEETVAKTRSSAAQLVERIDADEITALVMPDGELRFPRWQFASDGTVRTEFGPILDAARQSKLGALPLHLLMTKPGKAENGEALSSLLGREGVPGAPDKPLALIVAAIERETLARLRRDAARLGRSNVPHAEA